jgi:hypothetical protein
LKNDGVSFDHQSQTLAINTFKPAFIPRNVLKCFVKIAFGFLDESNLESYDETRRWLIGEVSDEDIPMHPYFFVPRAKNTKMFHDPMILLMRRKQLELPFAMPEHSLLIWYGVFIFQIYIPFHTSEEEQFGKRRIYIPIEEHLCEEIPSNEPLGAASVDIMNMGAKVKVKGASENFVLPFRDLRK